MARGNQARVEVALQHKRGACAVPAYRRRSGLRTYLNQVYVAAPMQVFEIERKGVDSAVVVVLAKQLGLPLPRLFAILNVPRSIALKKIQTGSYIGGHAGQVVVGLAALHHMAQDMVDQSTADEAKRFDVLKWLGGWLEVPQPCLGGCKPGDLLDTPTGLSLVLRTLGAISSGAYQ